MGGSSVGQIACLLAHKYWRWGVQILLQIAISEKFGTEYGSCALYLSHLAVILTNILLHARNKTDYLNWPFSASPSAVSPPPPGRGGFWAPTVRPLPMPLPLPGCWGAVAGDDCKTPCDAPYWNKSGKLLKWISMDLSVEPSSAYSALFGKHAATGMK